MKDEIVDYYKAGHSVVFYSHRTREQLQVYLERFNGLFKIKELEDAKIKGISFRRGTLRDYFFIIHKEHIEKIQEGIDALLNGKWSSHFTTIIN